MPLQASWTQPPSPKTPTFRAYTPAQARAYAVGRGASSIYPPALYEIILDHHAKTSGTFSLLLDVGCGPGNATRDIAANFVDAVGVDGSVEMINTARVEGVNAGRGMAVRFEVAEAEGIDSVPGSRRAVWI